MAWLTTFKLGIPGGELDLIGRVTIPSFDHKHVEQQQRNVAGDLKRTYLKTHVPIIGIQMTSLPMATIKRLLGFYKSLEPLNFISNNAFGVTDQQEISTSTTSVTLTNMCASGVTILGVYLRADTARAGTNYFTSGSYNATTRVITLGTPLPGANTQVWVDYNFTGYSVWMTALQPTPHEGHSQDLWRANIQLTGA